MALNPTVVWTSLTLSAALVVYGARPDAPAKQEHASSRVVVQDPATSYADPAVPDEIASSYSAYREHPGSKVIEEKL